MKYKNGRQLEPDSIAAIRFITKVGVLTRSTWYALFGRGSLRWKQQQLSNLIESEIFKPHSCKVIKDVFVLGKYGAMLAKEREWKYATRIDPIRINKADIVGIGLWKLELAGIVKKWMGEKEIKAHELHQFKFRVRKDFSKYPCALFSMGVQDKEEIVAVELEDMNRTSQGYHVSLQSIQGIRSLDRIFFIVSSDAILKSIQTGMRKLGDAELSAKIGFINLNDWQNDPVAALRRSVPLSVSEANTLVA